jgi:DNA-binding NtrC family response regulator
MTRIYIPRIASNRLISVLIAETDPLCRRAVQHLLRDRCHLCTSTDAREILELIRCCHFHTLFVDSDLPPPGPIDLFKKARILAPTTKRVLMTGENVENLQLYLNSKIIHTFVSRTSSNLEIVDAVTKPLSASF